MWTPDNWTNSNQWSSDKRSLNGMERMTDDESDMHGNGRGLKTSNCPRINLIKYHNKWVTSNNQNSPFQDMIGLKMWSWTSATHDNMNQIQVCLTSKMSEVFVGKGSKACNWLCNIAGGEESILIDQVAIWNKYGNYWLFTLLPNTKSAWSPYKLQAPVKYWKATREQTSHLLSSPYILLC